MRSTGAASGHGREGCAAVTERRALAQCRDIHPRATRRLEGAAEPNRSHTEKRTRLAARAYLPNDERRHALSRRCNSTLKLQLEQHNSADGTEAPARSGYNFPVARACANAAHPHDAAYANAVQYQCATNIAPRTARSKIIAVMFGRATARGPLPCGNAHTLVTSVHQAKAAMA